MIIHFLRRAVYEEQGEKDAHLACYIMYGVRYDITSIFQDLIRKLFPSQKCREYMNLPLLYYGNVGKRTECRIDLNMDKLFCKQTSTFHNSFL